jgi:hypothetical protein
VLRIQKAWASLERQGWLSCITLRWPPESSCASAELDCIGISGTEVSDTVVSVWLSSAWIISFLRCPMGSRDKYKQSGVARKERTISTLRQHI